MAILKELSAEDILLTQNNIRDLYCDNWTKRISWEKVLDEVDEETAERLEGLLEPLYMLHRDYGMLINSAGIIIEEKDYKELREQAQKNADYILRCYKDGKSICDMVWS